LAARGQRASAVEKSDGAVRVEHDRTVIVRDSKIGLSPKCIVIAAGHMDGCALRAGDFAARQRIEETRASGDRRFTRCSIVGIVAWLTIDRYLVGLRDRCCRNTGWDRKEKCGGTASERVHGASFSFTGGLPPRKAYCSMPLGQVWRILGAVAGVDFRRPALKLPGLGRLGA
jgi:hypothetical protein